MMDSLKNDLRLSCMIIVLEIQTFVCMTINLLFIVMAMLLTALLVVILVSLWAGPPTGGGNWGIFPRAPV